MAYFKVFKDSVADQRIFDLADRIAGIDLGDGERHQLIGLAALGAVMRLWSYADTYIDSDDQLHVSLGGLAGVLNMPVSVLREFPEEWLRVTPEGDVILPGYCKRNQMQGKDQRKVAYQKRREADRLRKARERTRRRLRADTERTDNGHDADSVQPTVGPPVPETGTGTAIAIATATETAIPRAGEAAAPAKRAAPLKTWVPVSQARGKRGKSFEEDFRRRFGVTPGEAADLREKKSEPDDDGPKF